MRVNRKASEIINRGITAIAMTIAIATIYAGMATKGQVSHGDILHHQLQTVFKLPDRNLQITQDAEESQESLPTLVISFHGKADSHR